MDPLASNYVKHYLCVSTETLGMMLGSVGLPLVLIHRRGQKRYLALLAYFFNIDEGCQLLLAREKCQLSFNGVFHGTFTQVEGLKVGAESRGMNTEWRSVQC